MLRDVTYVPCVTREREGQETVFRSAESFPASSSSLIDAGKLDKVNDIYMNMCIALA